MNLNIPPQIHEAMRLMKSGDLKAATAVLQGGVAHAPQVHEPVAREAQAGGTFQAHTFTGTAGSRGYKLFVPERHGSGAAAARRHAARLHPGPGRLRARHRA